ncbi:MAG: hypothetical protein WB630_15870 [Candidatus Acidiferrales bacterium]
MGKLLQVRAGVLRKHYNWNGRRYVQELTRSFQTVHPWHLKIHDH